MSPTLKLPIVQVPTDTIGSVIDRYSNDYRDKGNTNRDGKGNSTNRSNLTESILSFHGVDDVV